METIVSPSKKKILSLDGGGVRGLSSLLILQRIMRGLGNKMQPPQADLKPCEFFDLIGGTSTGGISAIMLGRLRMSVQECIDEYTILSKEIFSERKTGSSEMFYAENLEKAIKKVVRKKLGEHAGDAPLQDPLAEEACKAVVYTLRRQHANTAKAQALRTYKSEDPIDCTIWQAARATSAAPTFFETITFGNPPISWWDAGLGFNNPARLLLAEAGDIWRDGNDKFDRRDIGCFISLGTGKPKILRVDASGNVMERVAIDIANRLHVPPRVIMAMQTIITDSERVALELREELDRSLYYRFNVDQGLEEVQLFQYESQEIIAADTFEYITQKKDEIRDCIRLMAKFPNLSGPLQCAKWPPFESNLPDAPHNDMIRDKLASQQINEDRFRTKSAGLKKNRPELQQTTRVDEYWDYLVLGVILDEDGRKIRKDFEAKQEEGDVKEKSTRNKSRRSLSKKLDQQLIVYAEKVEIQSRSNELLWQAYKVFRGLRAEQLRNFGSSSLDELYSTHRLAGVSEMLGLLEDARQLYIASWKGHDRVLGPEYPKTQYAAFAVERLENHSSQAPQANTDSQKVKWWNKPKEVLSSVLKLGGAD